MKKWIIEKETMRELENQKVLFEFDGKTEELKKVAAVYTRGMQAIFSIFSGNLHWCKYNVGYSGKLKWQSLCRSCVQRRGR